MTHGPASDLIRHFQAFLEEAKLSRVSVKNYLSDVRLFLASISFSSLRELTTETVSRYLASIKATKPEATHRRYTASLRRFVTFLAIEYRLELPLPKAKDLESSASSSHNIASLFRQYLLRQKKTAATVKNYLSDLNHFLNWTANHPLPTVPAGQVAPLAAILTKQRLSDYFDHFKLTQTSSSVSDRRASSLRKFVQFSLDNNLVSHNPFETTAPLPQIATVSLAPLPKNPITSDQTTNPLAKLYYHYHTLPFTPYLHLAILILATMALGIYGYAQVFRDTATSQAYPASLTRPARQLAFQGRLTDSSDNPIQAATPATFRLFSKLEGGEPVYEAACSVLPDAEGVFSTQIGNGQCGPEISADVFSENNSLFLEVSLGGETLTPRQPIATSGYALNSETLQGYPASASATANTVPVVDADGAIVLADPSPAIIANSGTFAIKGQAVTMSTLPGTDGNVDIAPDGRGSVNIIGSLDKGIFMNVTDANLTTGTLIEGYVANNSRTGTLLHLASGTKQINRLTIYTTGQTDIIADTYTKPAFSIKQTGTGPIFSAKVGSNQVAQLSTAGDLGLLGGLTLGSPYTTHAWPGQIITNINSRGMGGVIINQNDSGPILVASSSGTNRFIVANNGNVGINTINPTQGALVVVGRTWTDQFTMAKNPVSGYVLTSDEGGNATWQASQGGSGGSGGGWTLAAPIVYTNLTSYQALIGATATASALGKLTVYGDVTSAPIAYLSGTTTAAALIIDNLGSGNLINASSSGTNKFTVANDGDITSAAIAVAGGVVWTDSTGNLNSVAGTTGQCLTSGGTGTPVWATCSTGSDTWQRNSGALSPANISDDVLVGATATASAFTKFSGTAGGNSWINTGNFGIATTTPGEKLDVVGNATISGNLTLYGGARTIASRLNTTLTIGDSQTGNIIIAPGGTTAITAISNDVTLADTLTINGSSVTLAGNDTIVDMTGTGTLSLNTVTNRAITTGTGQITLAGNVDATNGLDVTTANLTVGGANFTVAPASGDVTTAGDVAVNGGDLTTSATTFNLVNATATTLNIGGAAASMNLGPGGVTAASLNFVGGSGATGCTVDGATGNFTCSGAISTTATTGIQGWWQRNSGALSPTNLTDDVLLGTTATTSARIALFNVAAGTPTASLSAGLAGATYLTAAGNLQTTSNQSLTIGGATTGNITLSPLNGITAAYVAPNTDNQVDLGLASLRWRNVYAGTITGTLNPGFTEGSVVFIGPSGLAQDNANFFYNDSTNQLGLGTTSPLARLDARASNGITPTASISGATSFATLVVDNSGVGDIFTASSSGLNRFVITQAGNVGIGTRTPAYLLDVQGGTGVQVATFSGRVAGDFAVNANDFVTLSQVGTGGGGPWTRAVPNVYLTTGTDKVGIGTTAPSGKLQVINDVGTTPAASISATSSFAALVVDNSGVGDIFTASSSGLNRFVITQAGNVGIGTTTPGSLVALNGQSADTRLTLFSTTANLNSEIILGEANSNVGAGLWYDGSANAFKISTGTAGDIIDTAANTRLTILRDSGSIGINTTSPLATLDVRRNVGTAPAASISGATSFATLVVDNSGVGDIFTASSSGLNRFVITQAGNVGIGTTVPSTLLHLGSDAGTAGSGIQFGSDVSLYRSAANVLQTDDTFSAVTALQSGGTIEALRNFSVPQRFFISSANDASVPVLYVDSAGQITMNSQAATAIRFNWDKGTGGILIGNGASGEVARFQANGRIGINATSPLATLDVRSVLGTIPVASISGATSMAALVVDNSGVGDIFTASASGLNRFVITNAGNVGINTTLPTEALDLVGNATVSGNLTFYGGARTIASRLKTMLTIGDSQTGNITLSPHGGTLGAYVAPNTDIQVDLGQSTLRWRNVYAENVIATGLSGSIQGFWQRTTGSLTPAFITDDVLTGSISTTSAFVKLTGTPGNPSFINTGSFGVGTTTTLATTDLRSMLGTVAVASVSGATSFATLVVDNSLNYDIFAASSSGDTRFKIQSSGVFRAIRGDQFINFNPNYLAADTHALISSGTAGETSTMDLRLQAGTDDSANGITLKSTGNVGINTTTTLAGLDVRRNLGTTPTASISGATSVATLLIDNSLNYDILAASSSGARRLRLETTGDLTLYGSSGVATPPTGRLMPGFDSVQDVGASTAQWKSIYLSNAIQNGATVSINLATQHFGDNGAGLWTFDNHASVSGNLNVVGTTWLGCNVAYPPGCGNAFTSKLIVGVDGTGKADIGTIDPPYTINGEKYATYLPSMIGQNEEVTGNLTTTQLVENVGYRTTIDFSDLPKASNLWLFSKITSLKEHVRDLAVVLTPASASRAWYVLEPDRMLLHIYTSKPTTVSYRFSAPRFDSDQWHNTRPAESIAGFTITDPDTPLGNLVPDGPIALDATFAETNINQYDLTVGGDLVTEIGSYANLLTANLTAGIVNTQKLFSNEIASPIADIDTLRVNSKLLSPLIEVGEIIASTVSANTVAANEASVSGTLYAANLESPVIDTLTDNYQLLDAKYASASAILASIREKYNDYDSLTQPEEGQNASLSGTLALYNQPVIITDTLLVNTTLVSNSLNSAEGVLFLQPTASAPINLLAGLMTLTPDGQVTINGNLTVTGNLYANAITGAQTTTNQLSTSLATISGQLVLGKESTAAVPSNNLASFFNDSGELVSTINASGAASFKELATAGLVIANAATESATATSSAAFTTNASIGTGIITAGSTTVTIANSGIRTGTYIYLTPVTDTANQVLYIKTKEEGVGFTVAINQALATDVKFNYWLIQTQP